VHDAAPRRHPLHVAGLDRAAVAFEVLVRHGSLSDTEQPHHLIIYRGDDDDTIMLVSTLALRAGKGARNERGGWRRDRDILQSSCAKNVSRRRQIRCSLQLSIYGNLFLS
jgi:hypothetical protein